MRNKLNYEIVEAPKYFAS